MPVPGFTAITISSDLANELKSMSGDVAQRTKLPEPSYSQIIEMLVKYYSEK